MTGAWTSISPGDINVGQRASDGFPPEPTIDFAAAVILANGARQFSISR